MPNHAIPEEVVSHRTFAAIKISRDNIGTMLSCVSDSPNGENRLIYAMWNYPYKAGVTYYFVGGNYLKANYPDYSLHILTQDELDLLFSYNQPKARPGQRNPDINWFAVRLKEDELEEVLA
jgi:hypothetical protein